MGRKLWFALAMIFLLTLTGCSENQAQAVIPEIEYITLEGQQCPQFKIVDMDEDKIINTINEEIEAHFLSFIPHRVDGSAWDNIAIHTFTSSTDTSVSILLRLEFDIAYGTDGAIWGICYDYKDRMIVPCGAYLSGLGYSYAEAYENVWELLSEKSTYEHVSMPCFYFDSDSNPILVVEALEHPIGADAWSRIYYYSLKENSFVNSPWTA